MYYVNFVMMKGKTCVTATLSFSCFAVQLFFLTFAINKYINIELNQDTYIFKFKLLDLNSLSRENIQTILVSEFIVLRNI